jgi:hypothetical protein
MSRKNFKLLLMFKFLYNTGRKKFFKLDYNVIEKSITPRFVKELNYANKNNNNNKNNKAHRRKEVLIDENVQKILNRQVHKN